MHRIASINFTIEMGGIGIWPTREPEDERYNRIHSPIHGPSPASFQTNITIFTTNICAKNVHPVYIARIQTHDLRNMSFLLQPLDQGSRPLLRP